MLPCAFRLPRSGNLRRGVLSEKGTFDFENENGTCAAAAVMIVRAMVALEARLGEVSAAGGVEGSLQHSAAGGARLLVVGERHSGTNFVQALAEETWGDGAWFLPPAPGGGQHAGCEEEWQPGFDERTQLDVNVCCGKHGYLNESCVFRPPVEATIAVLRKCAALQTPTLPLARCACHAADGLSGERQPLLVAGRDA